MLSDSVYNVRVCFGIYMTDNMNESLSFMCDKASFAVASIKDDTHSFIAYYDDTMLEAAIKYKTIVDEFDEAIKAGEFKMYLQPQISAKTTIMSDVPNLMGELEELRKAGFTLEMDDFGSGYSSLNTLKDINVDVLKVDMGFIKETKNVKKSRIILASVIKMAKELNLLIITEGVETEEQVDNLTKLGCDVFEGYYFSKAIDVNEFEKRYLYRKKAG